MSHPTWVRGLKRSSLSPGFAYLGVAPYVGAWIETRKTLAIWYGSPCRTLRGCVD